MTIDDLVKIADRAEAELEWVLKEGDIQRAGIRAVVKALRDEARANWTHAENMFNEILGDTGEK